MDAVGKWIIKESGVVYRVQKRRKRMGIIRDYYYMLEITYTVYTGTGYDSSVALFVPDPFHGHRTHWKVQSITILLSIKKNSSYSIHSYGVRRLLMQINKVARLICCVASNRCILLHPQYSHVLSPYAWGLTVANGGALPSWIGKNEVDEVHSH